jgi:hypothetical protein
LPWRFTLRDSVHVSRKVRSVAGRAVVGNCGERV